MISVWLGDRSGWTGVRLAELDRSSFVDRSAGSWIGALVRGSEWIRALVCGSELVLSSSWIRVDRSAVRGSELFGSWIGVDRRYEMWIGARSLFLSVLLCVDRSSLCCCVCVCFVFLFSLFLCVAVRGE